MDFSRLRLEANKHSRWKKIRLAPLQEAYWIILLGIIFMLAGGAFVLLTMELFSA